MPAELVAKLPLLVIITLLASLLQGAVGFGFGLLAVAGLSLFVQLKVSTPLLALLNLPVILILFWRLRREVVWSGLTPIIAGMLIGIPFGIFVLVTWPEDLLLRILGVVLVLSAIRSAVPQANSGNGCEEQRTWWGLVVGLAVGLSTGALAGAFNTGGPPLIAYVYCRPGTKEQRTATLQAVFAISVVSRIILMAAPPARLYDSSVVLAALVCLPGALIGSFAGQAIFRRVPQRGLEIFVSLFLLVVGVKSLIWP